MMIRITNFREPFFAGKSHCSMSNLAPRSPRNFPMSIQSFFKSLTSPSPRRRPARRNFRPQLEALEDRSLMSFTPAANYAVGLNPTAVTAADFNRDGYDDIAVANYGDDTVSILLS